jgi:hypothetical protein
VEANCSGHPLHPQAEGRYYNFTAVFIAFYARRDTKTRAGFMIRRPSGFFPQGERVEIVADFSAITTPML